MSEEIARIHQPAAEISEEALKRAEELIEQEEGVQNKFRGRLADFITAVAVLMSLFHLYAAYQIVRTEVLRATHVSFVLFLCFLIFPVSRRFRHRVMAWDWALAALGVAIALYLVANGDDFFDRSILPNSWDVVFGVALIVLVLEAMRRATGWIMPAITFCFLLYAIFGPYLPAPWTHKGYEIPRLIGHMYMTLEGIYGVAVDVSSSLIILFTIYGAFLQYSGAGKFYIDFSFSAMGGKPTGAGRTVVLASFLLGGPSGSRCHHRDARLGRLSDAHQGRLRQGRGGRPARRGRAGRDHFAAGAGRGRLPDRRVPQDLVPRRDPDGDDPDLPVLPRAVRHGRDRRAQIRHEGRYFRARRIGVEPEQEILVPLPVAGVDRGVHAVGLLARDGGVLGDARLRGDELPEGRYRAYPVRRFQEKTPACSRPVGLGAGESARRRLARGAERRCHLRRRRIIVGTVTLTGLGLKF